MKNSSLGSIIAASALAVAPSAAYAQDPSASATTVDPAPVLTTPAADNLPQVADPSTTPSTSNRRQRRAQARTDQADRTTKDPVPTAQATDPSLAAPSLLEIKAVPNFFIEDFDIPPFLIPIYQAAGSEYGIPWEVLASINRIETAFGTNLNISSAGALGWMQFMPATWEQYGVDANGDGKKDPFNPADAIFAAARYLRAAGGDTDLNRAVFAYNHADWYVQDVLEGASQIAAIPEPIISSLAALTQGLFPIDAADAKIAYRDKVESPDEKTVAPGDEASDSIEGDTEQNSIDITAPAGSAVVAVQDGVVEKVGRSERLGTYVRLRDAYGNRYTYAHLGEVQDKVPVPKPGKDENHKGHDHADHEGADDVTATDETAESVEPTTPVAPSTPTDNEQTGATVDATDAQARERLAAQQQDEEVAKANPAYKPRKIRLRARTPVDLEQKAQPAPTRSERLFAHPTQPDAYAAGGKEQLEPTTVEDVETPTGSISEYFSIDYGLDESDVTLRKLKAGTQVIAGTVLGRLAGAPESGEVSKLTFEIRPAGKKAPRIDPKPILDGWRLMDRTAFYKAQVVEAVEAGKAGDEVTAGQVLLMSKAELQDRVLSNKRINIYECGRRDIRAGIIDRRILALIEYLAVKGAEPSISSLQCGHGLYTASGNISQHSTGSAVDISVVYGSVISAATQGAGSPTDRAVREILKLQGNMRPDQIITLMKYEGADNTLAMGDHADHIHVGYRPITDADGKQLELLIGPGQWDDLLDQVGSIKTPSVSTTPSDYSITVKRSSEK